MINKRKILFSLAFPMLIGIVFLLSIINTCQRIPELILQITTDTIESLPGREYKLTGSIVSFGQEEITQHGFCWSETSNPTTEEPATQLGDKESKGNFTSTISDLTANTKFYVRAYVVTKAGTEYGKEKTFTTPAPSLATVVTTDVSNPIQDPAISGGTITDDGGASITARGVCWDTTSSPTLDNSYTTDETGTGSFTSEITGLECAIKYYVRAYATNEAGTAYGNPVEFTTSQCPFNLPIVLTASVISNITSTSAQSGGTVTEDGGGIVYARGVCWNASSFPTVSDFTTIDGAGLGDYISTLSGLEPNTTYYLRAYATNSNGTAYGDNRSFTTSQ